MANRGKGVLRVIALATLGVGLGWLLSDHESRWWANIRPQAAPEYATEKIIPPPVTPAILDISRSQSNGDAAELSSAPTSGAPPGVTLAELEREYGDPTIARGAKLTIQRVLNTKL